MNNIFKRRPKEVVDITNPTKYSILGKYFIGQTGEFSFGNQFNAWGGLINPTDSKVNLFFDIFTITNFSTQSFNSEFFLNSRMPVKGKVSSIVTPSNQGISPPPKPKAMLKYGDYLSVSPIEGSNIFGRIIPENSTLVSDSHKGSIIIGPGGSLIIFLKSPGLRTVKGTIVMTWWEERI